jgi:hypothetical protein
MTYDYQIPLAGHTLDTSPVDAESM